MSLELYKMLNAEVTLRTDTQLTVEMDEMTRIYEGELPERYDAMFPQNAPRQIVNMIRLGWDDLAVQIGRFPELRADPQDNSDDEERTVGLLEKIGTNYLRSAEPSGKILLRMLAWWLVGTGRACLVALPNQDKKLPVLSYRDPRTVYPNPKRTVGNQIVELEDVMFKYELPIREMRNRGLAAKTDHRGRQPSDEEKGTVIEYIDAEKWVLVSDGGTAHTVYHNLGIVPAWVFQTFAPNKKALSQFQDQVVFMVAISRMLSQKLRYGDRLAHPLLWVRGHEGTVNIGPDILTKLGPQGEMGQISPPTQLQVDRDIASLERFSRILNRNPESRQGEVQAKGVYMSAKTLEQLSEAIDTVVGGYWDIISVGLAHLIAACYAMDEKFWPDTEKSLFGIEKGTKFKTVYTPSKDIAGRRHVTVEYGFGFGGYQGFLMEVQMNQAGLQSRRGAIEKMPGTSDVDDKLREIEIEQMEDAGKANFASQAATGQMDMILWAKLLKEMKGNGKPMAEVILSYYEELAEQAKRAAEAQGQAGAMPMTVPPGEEPPPALPGMPPAPMIGL